MLSKKNISMVCWIGSSKKQPQVVKLIGLVFIMTKWIKEWVANAICR